jgi:hypothetical protein
MFTAQGVQSSTSEIKMRILALVCAVVMCCGVAQAQVQQAKALSPFEQELITNHHQFMQALAEKNVAAVNAAVADDFRGIGTNGDSYDREEIVASAQEGLPKDIRVYELRVVRVDDDAAVVSYNLIVPGSRIRYRHMSDTWAKEDGKWKLKFQQATINLWSAMDFD